MARNQSSESAARNSVNLKPTVVTVCVVGSPDHLMPWVGLIFEREWMLKLWLSNEGNSRGTKVTLSKDLGYRL